MNDFQDLKEFTLPDGFRGRSAVYVQLWWLVQFFFFHPSPQFMYGWRRFLLRLFGARLGKSVLIRPTASITYPWKLSVGDYSWIGDNVTLYNLGEIVIGDNTVISQNCYICTGTHDYRSVKFDIYSEPVTIGPEVWLASDVFVFPGITVNKGSVVAARSTVVDDVPPGIVVKGNPAIFIKNRNIRH